MIHRHSWQWIAKIEGGKVNDAILWCRKCGAFVQSDCNTPIYKTIVYPDMTKKIITETEEK